MRATSAEPTLFWSCVDGSPCPNPGIPEGGQWLVPRPVPRGVRAGSPGPQASSAWPGPQGVLCWGLMRAGCRRGAASPLHFYLRCLGIPCGQKVPPNAACGLFDYKVRCLLVSARISLLSHCTTAPSLSLSSHQCCDGQCFLDTGCFMHSWSMVPGVKSRPWSTGSQPPAAMTAIPVLPQVYVN